MPANPLPKIAAAGGLARDIFSTSPFMLGGALSGLGHGLFRDEGTFGEAFAKGFAKVPGAVEGARLLDTRTRAAQEAGVHPELITALDWATPDAIPGPGLAGLGMTPVLATEMMRRHGANFADDVVRATPGAITRGQEALPPNLRRYVSEPGDFPNREFWLSRKGRSGFTTAYDPETSSIDVGAFFNQPGAPRGATEEAFRLAVREADRKGAKNVTLDAFDAEGSGLLENYKRWGFEQKGEADFDPSFLSAEELAAWGDDVPDRVVYMRMSDEAMDRYRRQDAGQKGFISERQLDPDPGIQPLMLMEQRGPLSTGQGGTAGGLARTTPSGLPAYLPEDLGALADVPNVPQRELRRGELPELSQPLQERVEELYSPHNVQTVQEAMERGAEMGGPAWYNLEPLRASAMDVLGEEAGDAAFKRLALLLGATSPRSTVKQNVRRASLGHHLASQGQPFPRRPETAGFEGYGHLAGGVQQPYIDKAMQGLAPDPVMQPKITSFGENLMGNQAPGTIDTHNAIQAGWIEPGQTLSVSHYPLLEEFNAEMGSHLGLTPAQSQASLWMGMGEVSGVEDVRVFMQQFNDTLARTAEKLGKPQGEVLRGFWEGKWPLYGATGAITVDQLMGGDEA